MTRPTLLTVVGARPQFIKAAVVSRALAAQGRFAEAIVHTGQHYDDDLSAVFFAELGIPAPVANLGVGSGGHGEQTGQMLIALERELLARAPRAVLIYGDTNSTLAAAVAAAKLHIPVAHVEAGLRSFNMRMPEEINRLVADRLSTRLYTPTATADANLAREGFDAASIHRVGDVMYDAALLFGARGDAASDSRSDKRGNTTGDSPSAPPMALVTVHRAENTDDPARLAVICAALRQLATRMRVVLPLHPRTRAAIDRAGERLDGVEVLAPQGYLEMTRLLRQAQVIVTDSGGVQKEAYFHQVPCVTLRDETEWEELVRGGWNRLAPPSSPDVISAAIDEALSSRPAPLDAPYGHGDAGVRIATDLAAHFGDRA